MIPIAIGIAMTSEPFTAGFVDELVEIFSDSTLNASTPTKYSVDVPRGSIAGVHILINGLTPGTVVTLSGGGKLGKWYRLVDVPVEINSGVEGWTEANTGKQNPNVIRRAPFRIFDALRPLEGSSFSPESSTAALRFEMPVSRSDKPSTKTLQLSMTQAKHIKKLSFDVRVRNVSVPPVGRESIKYTSWWSIDNIAKYHHVEPWSEGFWRMLEQYADLMARSRQNTILTPWSSFVTKEREAFRLDRAKLKRFVKVFEDRGIYWLEGGHFAGRENGVWSANHFTLNLTGKRVNEPEGSKEFKAVAQELDEAIRKEGWGSRWFQHLADEPIDDNAEDYLKMAAQAKQYMPGIPIFDATMSVKLVGAVDIWCPKMHEFQQAKTWFDQRKAAQDRVWAYTCCDPGGNWLNRFLDFERIRPVFIGWAVVKFDLDGFLHWGFNYWEADPFEKSVTKPGEAWILPAGDSHIAFPGKDGPISSTRLEAQRIGFEDGELLRILKRKDLRTYEKVVEPVFRAADDYTKDVPAYRRARTELFGEVERHK